MTQRKTIRNHPKQGQTRKVPTYNVENTNGTNKGSDLRLANKSRTVPREIKWILPRIQRHRRATLHWSTHPQREQNETKKSSDIVDWLQKGIWYGPAMLDNELPQNEQNIRWRHKFNRENHEKLESEIDSRRENLSWNEDLVRYILGKCTITITSCYSDDATQPHTWEMCWRIQTI